MSKISMKSMLNMFTLFPAIFALFLFRKLSSMNMSVKHCNVSFLLMIAIGFCYLCISCVNGVNNAEFYINRSDPANAKRMLAKVGEVYTISLYIEDGYKRVERLVDRVEHVDENYDEKFGEYHSFSTSSSKSVSSSTTTVPLSAKTSSPTVETETFQTRSGFYGWVSFIY